MRRIRPRDPPPLPWVKPEDCVHPNLIVLLRFCDADENVFRCMACGKTMTRRDVHVVQSCEVKDGSE